MILAEKDAHVARHAYAACCSVLQCVAGCSRVLQCVAKCCIVLQRVAVREAQRPCVKVSSGRNSQE